jgi:CRP-like cAMP-binding protein
VNRKQNAVNPSTVESIPLFASVPRRRRWHVATSPMRLLVLARHQFRELLFAAPTVAAPIRRAAAARA